MNISTKYVIFYADYITNLDKEKLKKYPLEAYELYTSNDNLDLDLRTAIERHNITHDFLWSKDLDMPIGFAFYILNLLGIYNTESVSCYNIRENYEQIDGGNVLIIRFHK